MTRNEMLTEIITGIKDLDAETMPIGRIVTENEAMLIRVGMLLGIGACIDVVGQCVKRLENETTD